MLMLMGGRVFFGDRHPGGSRASRGHAQSFVGVISVGAVEHVRLLAIGVPAPRGVADLASERRRVFVNEGAGETMPSTFFFGGAWGGSGPGTIVAVFGPETIPPGQVLGLARYGSDGGLDVGLASVDSCDEAV